jgi:hypothetical protein
MRKLTLFTISHSVTSLGIGIAVGNATDHIYQAVGLGLWATFQVFGIIAVRRIGSSVCKRITVTTT